MSKHVKAGKGNTRRNTKTGKYAKEGINDIDLYDMWRYLENVKIKVANLKNDLQRDCIPYYKYDEFIEDVNLNQDVLKEKDRLKELS